MDEEAAVVTKIPIDDITRRMDKMWRSLRPNLLFQPMTIVVATHVPGP